ncbi:MAG: zf-HC2 domain-containing protein [Clostridiales bacterium]|nr:zf-HC2 domain-containing protein [Clostridiales bacterium]
MNKQCLLHIEQINMLIDGTISNKDNQKLKIHLSTCPDCQMYKKDMITLKKELSLVSLTLPKHFSNQVMNEINNRKKQKIIKFNRFIKYSASAVAACLIIVVGFSLLNSNFIEMKSAEFGEGSREVASLDDTVPENGMYTTDNALAEENTKNQAKFNENYDDLSYDYLYNNKLISKEDMENLLLNTYNITNMLIDDDCIVFTTSYDNYLKIIKEVKLNLIEENKTDSENVTIKIIINGE